jgi:hypothetical protein
LKRKKDENGNERGLLFVVGEMTISLGERSVIFSPLILLTESEDLLSTKFVLTVSLAID